MLSDSNQTDILSLLCTRFAGDADGEDESEGEGRGSHPEEVEPQTL